MAGELVLEWDAAGGRLRRVLGADERVVLGRGAECDIPVSGEATVSRRHAEVYGENGSFFVKNLSVTNAVHLEDGTRLEQGEVARLRPGERFRMGPIWVATSGDRPAAERITGPEAETPVAHGRAPSGPAEPGGRPEGGPGRARKILCSKCGALNDYHPERYCWRCGMALAGCQTIYA